MSEERQNALLNIHAALNKIAERFPEDMPVVYNMVNQAHVQSVRNLQIRNQNLSEMINLMAATTILPKKAVITRQAMLCKLKNHLEGSGYAAHGAPIDKMLYDAVCEDLENDGGAKNV